jgi:hypothetical protein
MRNIIVVLILSWFMLCGCDSLRFAPGEAQKQNVWLHARTAIIAAETARDEAASEKLQALTKLSLQKIFWPNQTGNLHERLWLNRRKDPMRGRWRITRLSWLLASVLYWAACTVQGRSGSCNRPGQSRRLYRRLLLAMSFSKNRMTLP